MGLEGEIYGLVAISVGIIGDKKSKKHRKAELGSFCVTPFCSELTRVLQSPKTKVCPKQDGKTLGGDLVP